MFDRAGRIVLFNRRYVEMYKLSRDIVKPGCTLRQLIQHRKETGLFVGDVDKYCREILESVAAGKTTTFHVPDADGHIIRAVNHPMPTGGGWIVTHEDVTEQQRFEKQQVENAERERRHVSLESAISSFRGHVDTLLGTVGQSAQAMHSTATTLSASSAETSQYSEGVIAAMNDASTSIKTASIAIDEMVRSTTEISRQVDQVNAVVQMTVNEAQATSCKIAAQVQATQRIGEVVKFIQDIAKQTSLLALNAAVEAARAGATGRGFAVVASEVKSLAARTSKATEEITAQIQAVKDSTRDSVECIHGVAARVQEINRHTSVVVSSVGNQSVATTQISAHVAGAAHASEVVTTALDKVDKSATQTLASAQTVLAATQAVEMSVAHLKAEVDGFLGKVVA